jgi:hypothetical protein
MNADMGSMRLQLIMLPAVQIYRIALIEPDCGDTNENVLELIKQMHLIKQRLITQISLFEAQRTSNTVAVQLPGTTSRGQLAAQKKHHSYC